ncbi:MAG: PD40 domain-containing protein [Myxococcales bacterium]
MTRSCLWAAAICLLLAGAAPAQDDPRHAWLTIDTPHFEVHYHQGEQRLAAKVARMAELAHAKLAPLLEHARAERCKVVVRDKTDFANGSAPPLLFNTIRVYAPPPDPRSTLNDFDDFLWELISHEYTHILHLDTVLGVPALANGIFGKLWIPNGGQPAWFIEGLAVYEESALSGSGRIRSAQEEMAVRAEALEGSFPRIDQLSNLTLSWPRGSSWYTLGGRFVGWIGSRFGAGAVRDLSHDFGGRAVPLGLNLSAESVLGQSYLDLYAQFRDEEIARARDAARRVRDEGETLAERLTSLGEAVGSPRFSPDGQRLYYASRGADRRPELRELPLTPCCSAAGAFSGGVRPGDRRVASSFGSNRLAVDPRGRLVYARPEVFQEFAEVEDLYAVGLDGGGGERLTRGLRASEPDVGRDGSLVFALRKEGGRTAIALLEPGASEPRILFEDEGREPVGSPRFSPDGAQVAFTHHRQGAWNLDLVGRDGRGPAQLTSGRALSRDPSFSPDGRYLLFASDRSGIYDLYALQLSDRALFRVTHMVAGAFEPEVSPDAKQVALVTYSVRGYDLSRIPYRPDGWTRVAPDAVAVEAVGAGSGQPHPGGSADRPALAPAPPQELYPVRAYDPLPTLRPHYWLPYAGSDGAGTILGALTSGFDVVGRHAYAAAAWWSLQGRMPGWDLSYTNSTLYPALTATASRDLVVPAGLPFNTERQVQGGLFASFPFTSVERRFSLGLGYQLTHLAQNEDPYNFAPPDGLIAAGQISLAYSDARRFVRSISAEEGQRASVVLRVAHPALGSDFSFRQATASVARYLAMPWTFRGRPLHHVLAARLSGGLAKGDLARRHLFELGGFDAGDPVQAILNPSGAPVRVLRGFRASSFAGEAYALATLEYRFLLGDVDAGAWTLPLYLRRVHAAVFADGGDAWNPFDERGPSRRLLPRRFALHVGAGAELRLETVLGYVLPTDVRIGCARGLERSSLAILGCYTAVGGVF